MKYEIDTQKKFKREFKDHWTTLKSCSSFEGDKKEEKLLLLECLDSDGHISPKKYNTFYNRILEGRL